MSAEPVAVAEVYRAHYGGRARNVGFNSVRMLVSADSVVPGDKLYDRATLDAAVAAARAEEQERCAKACDKQFWLETRKGQVDAAIGAGNCAAAIRDLKLKNK